MGNSSDIAQRRALARKNDDPEYRVRRAALIKTAAEVFRRKGFTAARLQDIAAEVGLDRASVYYYVSGKEELYREAVGEAVLHNIEMVEDLRAAALPSDQKLRALIEHVMSSYERHYPYLYVFVQEDMKHMNDKGAWNREMLALSRRFNEAVSDIIGAGLADGSFNFPITDTRLIANALIGMCNWSHRWFQPNKKWSAKTVSDTFIELVLNGLVQAPRAAKAGAAQKARSGHSA